MAALDSKPLPGDADRRLHTRHAVTLKGTVQVLIPERSMTPYGVDCEILDLSVSGMRVRLDRMEKSLFADMLKAVRMARISFAGPASEEPLRLRGGVAWMQYEKQKAEQDSGPCYLGISLEKADAELGRYRRFLAERMPG